MRRRNAILACLILLFLAGCGPRSRPCIQTDEFTLKQEFFMIPAEYKTPLGSSTVELEAMAVYPNDGQPHPLFLITHGSA